MSLLTFLLTYQISNHIQAYYIGLESTDAVKKKFFTMTKL